MKTLRYVRRKVARLTVSRADHPAHRDSHAIDDPIELRLEVGGAVRQIVTRGGALPDAAATGWSAAIPNAPWVLPVDDTEIELAGIAVEVRDPRARAVAWERWLAAATGTSLPAIRTVPVRPRALARAMAFPIRILRLGPDSTPLDDLLAAIFGYTDHRTVFEVAHEPIAATGTATPPVSADIVHLTLAAGTDWIDAGRPDRAARQLTRRIGRWGTRLLVLEQAPPEELPAWRAVAQALAERGGPAVLLIDGNIAQLRSLYADLVHDHPLDRILGALRMHGDAELVGGSGREELVRISSIATALPELIDWLETLVPYEAGGLESMPGASNDQVARSIGPDASELRGALADARRELDAVRFDHETTGTLPSSRTARMLRQVYRAVRGDASFEALPPPPDSRTVNARLAHNDDAGAGEPVDPHTGRLAPEQPIRLDITIAVPDRSLQRIGRVEYIEKAVTFDPGETETVIEVGVTGIDFTVFGSAVQELRLPRQGPSDTASFTLVPRAATDIAGVARLRFCLYHRNNLLQSYRLVSVLDRPDGEPGEPRLAAACALALGVAADAVPADVRGGYLTRLEYSAFDCSCAEAAPPRTLSLFANDSAGKNIITAKGEDLFSARVLPDLSDAVERCRAALKAISEREGIIPGRPVYAFDRAPTDEEWANAMAELAHKGWDLYSQLVPVEQLSDVAETLSGSGTIIHAAQHDVEHVLPWSLLYMREYDAGRTESGGKPVLRAVCPAGMPAADGTLDDARCNDRADCLLHDARIQAARAAGGPVPLPETIACPRQFWGFRHVIEVPVQQVKARATSSQNTALATEATRPMVDVVSCKGPARILVGYNNHLDLATSHLAELADRLAQVGAEVPFIPTPTCKRDTILDALGTAGSQVVYFYSHALPSLLAPDGRKLLGPHLELENFPDARGRIEPGNILRLRLPGTPLVFLNGCSTVGFSASAPSRFIENFVARGAAAVIGTETTVWEQLAGLMAIAFLERFLSRQPAGEALLRARRVLLAERNPLGLIYTLYGPAQLQLRAM